MVENVADEKNDGQVPTPPVSQRHYVSMMFQKRRVCQGSSNAKVVEAEYR
jgi:hypothetical protein